MPPAIHAVPPCQMIQGQKPPRRTATQTKLYRAGSRFLLVGEVLRFRWLRIWSVGQLWHV